MEEFDSHTEHAQDQAHEAAHESRERWITGVALTAAILAALAAITSMLSGHHEHESMMKQMEAADKWNYYQAKGIKAILRENHIEDLEAAGEKVPDGQRKKLEKYRKEQGEIKAEAEALETSSHFHDDLHMVFGGGVTLFQVAIAVAAISALTRRKRDWFVGLGLGALALGFLVAGILVWRGVVGHRPPPSPENPAVAVSQAWPAPM
jgi:ferric-dicitrate binding protein FerR (iron transport regulator)